MKHSVHKFNVQLVILWLDDEMLHHFLHFLDGLVANNIKLELDELKIQVEDLVFHLYEFWGGNIELPKLIANQQDGSSNNTFWTAAFKLVFVACYNSFDDAGHTKGNVQDVASRLAIHRGRMNGVGFHSSSFCVELVFEKASF